MTKEYIQINIKSLIQEKGVIHYSIIWSRLKNRLRMDLPTNAVL